MEAVLQIIICALVFILIVILVVRIIALEAEVEALTEKCFRLMKKLGEEYIKQIENYG
ncbi:MAG: hypothetical protein WC914_00195 [Proteiniphilum sp.]